MKYKIQILLLLCVFLFLVSCRPIVTKIVMTTYKSAIEKKKVLYNTENETTVVFIPMQHIAKPQVYTEVKKYIDSARNTGAVIFYEGVGVDPTMNAKKLDTLYRKRRAVTGRMLGGDGYKNPNNKSIPKYIRNKKKVVNQTRENTGIIDSIDIHADYNLDQLIAKYESEYGKIILTDCDFQTPLFEKYKCREQKNKYNSYKFINVYRDENLRAVVDSNRAKTKVVLYGAGHWWRFYPYFRDKGYILKEGKVGFCIIGKMKCAVFTK